MPYQPLPEKIGAFISTDLYNITRDGVVYQDGERVRGFLSGHDVEFIARVWANSELGNGVFNNLVNVIVGAHVAAVTSSYRGGPLAL